MPEHIGGTHWQLLPGESVDTNKGTIVGPHVLRVLSYGWQEEDECFAFGIQFRDTYWDVCGPEDDFRSVVIKQ